MIMLSIPPDVKVFELTTATIWFDKAGVLYSISKKVPLQTLDQAKASLEDFLSYLGDQKVCMLLDVTHTTESPREIRDFASEQLVKITKAIAMVSESMLGKMLANLFFKLKSQPYPVKMFNNELEAREWLDQYL